MSQVLPKDVPQTLRKWKRYSAYKDSGVEELGEVPTHWKITKLRWYLSLRSGDYISNSDFDIEADDSKGFPVIGGNGVAGFSAQYNVCKPTIAIGRVGALCGNIHLINENSWVTDNALLITNWREFEREYLGLLLTVMDLNKQASQNAQPLITGSLVKNQIAALPPVTEQQAIASFLDRETAKIDALIAKKERLIELLQEKRTAIISHAVTKGLDPTVPLKDSGIEWLGKIPAHWQVKRIRAITESIQTGPFGSQLHSEEYVSGGIPVINPSHLKDGQIEPDWDCAVDKPTWQRLSRHELHEGDIIFARRGEMGRCALVTAAEAGWLCGTGSLRMRLKRDVAYPQFLNWILSTSGVRDWLLLESVGATMDNLNTTILARVPLSVPPFDEQVAIASYLDRDTAQIDALIAKIREGIEKLKEYRTALISAAVTGKIDVRNEVA